MIRYWQKYRFKLTFLLVVFFSSVIVLTVSGNLILIFARKPIQQYLLHNNITIGRSLFLPPREIFFTGIAFPDSGLSSPAQRIVIPKVKVRFSVPALLFQGKLYVTDIVLYRPQAHYYEFYRVIRDNFRQIVDFFLQLPKQDIRVFIHDARFGLTQAKDLPAAYGTFSLALSVKNNHLEGYGAVGYEVQNRVLKRNLPLRFSFSGLRQEKGFAIEKLELARENLYSQLWLDVSGSTCKINGFTFVNTLFHEYEYQKPRFGTVKSAQAFLRAMQSINEGEGLPRANLHILDIDCLCKFDFPRIRFERFNFALNNNPLAMHGEVVLTDPVSLDLKLATYLTPLGEFQVENLKKIEMIVKGIVKGSVFKGGLSINLDFMKKKKGNPPLQRAEIDLEDLKCDMGFFPKVATRISDIHLFFRTDSNEYRFSFKDFFAQWYLRKDRFKYVDFNAQFYDGVLHGMASIDLARLPPLIKSIVRIRQVSANKLAGILVHFSKVYGKLDSFMYFNNFPRFDLEGKMVIYNGYLKNFEFFKWLSEFLNLESLKKIDFYRAYSNFSIDAQGASLHEINLDASDVNIDGYFKLGHGDLVASQLSLGFSQPLLSQSPKLASLLKLFKESENVVFDFRLSGNLHRMNFQWLQSDFKKRLQDRIPNFIEKQIENNIEGFIQSMYLK